MNSAGSVIESGQRRAALLLHAMHGDDRDWVLAALPAAHRTQLQGLLAELAALGIPAERDLLGQLAAPGPLEALSDAAADRLAVLLEAEPPQIAAWLLASVPPDWRDRLRGRCNAAFASQVDAATRQAPAAVHAVRRCVMNELQALPEPGQRARGRWPATLLRGLRR